MSRYILIRRLRGPAFLLLVGVIALLAQADILRWSQSWPLFLILAGLLMLAERAALAAEGYPLFPGRRRIRLAGSGAQGNSTAANRGNGDCAAHPHDLENDVNGGQS